MDEIELLTKKVYELQDLVTALTLSVKYGDQEPLEAFMAQNGIGGEARTAVNLALHAILTRAQGGDPSPRPDSALLATFPQLTSAFRAAPITLDEAQHTLADLVGSPERARELLQAHKARGLSPEGHAALGT